MLTGIFKIIEKQQRYVLLDVKNCVIFLAFDSFQFLSLVGNIYHFPKKLAKLAENPPKYGPSMIFRL